MGNRVRYYRKRAGLSQTELAKRVNSGRSTIVKLERGERPLNSQWLDKLSRELDCTASDLVGDDVAVVGRIGAGGSIIFEEVVLDTVRRPPETSGELVGLEVAGDSMLPKFDPGDIIFISRDHQGVMAEYMGIIYMTPDHRASNRLSSARSCGSVGSKIWRMQDRHVTFSESCRTDVSTLEDQRLPAPHTGPERLYAT